MSTKNQLQLTRDLIYGSEKVVMIGLDGEMSSPELAEGGRLIQAGFAMMVDGKVEVFTSNIGSPVDSWEEGSWSEKAFSIHKITKEELEAAPTAKEVDLLAYQWLIDRGATAGERALVSIGFNVAAFDHPFFRKYLPKTMSLISRRAVELNSLCFTLAGWDPTPGNSARGWTGWKGSIKATADGELDRLGVEVAHHDAGYDAAQALVGWLWVRGEIRSTSKPSRFNPLPGQERMMAAIFGASLLTQLSACLDDEALHRLAAAVALSGREAGKVIASKDARGADGFDLIKSEKLDLLIKRFAAVE